LMKTSHRMLRISFQFIGFLKGELACALPYAFPILALIMCFMGRVHAVDFTDYTDKTAFLAALSPDDYTETHNTLAVNTLLSSPIVMNSGPNHFLVAADSGDIRNLDNGSDVWANDGSPIRFRHIRSVC